MPARLGAILCVVACGLSAACSVPTAAIPTAEQAIESAPQPPTDMDLDIARTAYTHEETGLGGMAHCLRFADLRCTRSSHDQAEFHCTYHEWRENGAWAPKTAVLRKDGSDWHWLSGDSPKCSITIFN